MQGVWRERGGEKQESSYDYRHTVSSRTGSKAKRNRWLT